MAVNHIVWIKFKQQINADRINTHLENLRALKDNVPGILDLSLGENFTDRANGFTHCLTITLADKSALQRYATHPNHVIVASPLAEDAEYLVLDYEF